MAEELSRGAVNSISTAAKIYPVEIEFEDLVLREFSLERESKDALLDLSNERSVIGEEDVTSELLSDGRTALAPMPAVESHFDRSCDSNRVNANVASESPVFG